MAIQYKNARFALATTALTSVLTLSVSSRAILQNIQTENISTVTTTVTAHVYDASATNTSQITTTL